MNVKKKKVSKVFTVEECIKIRHLCLSFIRYLKDVKKYASHTLKAYEKDLEQYFFQKKDIDFEINFKKKPTLSIDEKKLKSILLKNLSLWTPLSRSSKNRKIATLKSFFKWLYKNKYVSENFGLELKSPKVEHKIPDFLSVDEVLFLIEHLQKETKKDKKYLEDLALVALLYGGGLRVSEACDLKWESLFLDRATIKVLGKGGKERFVAVPDVTISILRKLKKRDTSSQFVFKKLSSRKAYKMVKEAGMRAGLLNPLKPHSLRHSFATHLLSGGSDLRTLQELLGHKSLTATQKYTHLSLEKLSETLSKCHPLEIKEN